MVTLPAAPQLPKSRELKSLGYDFALLGLQGREARVDVIRYAAERTASKIPSTLEAPERVEMLAELAASTYRLLDPRRRRRSMERVQLSLASENDPSLATVARRPLVPAPVIVPVTVSMRAVDPLVAAEIVQSGIVTVQLASKVSQDSVSRAGEEKLPRKSTRNSRVGSVALSALATLIGSTALVAAYLLN